MTDSVVQKGGRLMILGLITMLIFAIIAMILLPYIIGVILFIAAIIFGVIAVCKWSNKVSNEEANKTSMNK